MALPKQRMHAQNNLTHTLSFGKGSACELYISELVWPDVWWANTLEEDLQQALYFLACRFFSPILTPTLFLTG